MAWYYDRFPPKTTVAQRRAMAGREAAALAKKGQVLRPVRIEGRTIATTFWGQAWCEYFEEYSDYANRLPRGRSYVRNGSVLDLQLEAGKVRAVVSGSRVYQVNIEIKPLDPKRWKTLVKSCAGQIDSVVELLSGELSDGVMERLCDPKEGLFPASRELTMSCSCPDWAGLCKHLAAVLYGIGARFDREPELLFLLRGVDKLDLVSEAAGGALAQKPAGEPELEGGLSELFGIELDSGAAPVAPKAPKRKPKRKAAPAKKIKVASGPRKPRRRT